jgi:hypothetical protein
MDNNTLRIKVQERLNKLASQDVDNIESWQIAEAFNKAQLEFTRRQVQGLNPRQTGDEGSKSLVDDLQVLLVGKSLAVTDRGAYVETVPLPGDYLYFKRLSCLSSNKCCPARPLTTYLAQEADVDVLLRDEFNKPSFEWGESFCTLQGNRVRIYHNREFEVSNVVLSYYRKPRPISFEDAVDLETGQPTPNVACEFKDDVAEILIDEAVSILAADMENMQQYQRNKQNAQANT